MPRSHVNAVKLLSFIATSFAVCAISHGDAKAEAPVEDSAAIAAAKPICLHPKNPHIFEFRGQPAVLVTSGEHYGAVLNQDFDFIAYLDELQRHGLNQTRTFSGVYTEAWGEPWNTLNPEPGRYLAPWARSDQPGYADGGNKFDLTRWDDAYWTRLKRFVGEAGRRGIVVEYVLFCVHYQGDREWNLSPLKAGNNVNGVGQGDRKDFFQATVPDWTEAQERFVKKAARELKGFDNVYFELCNEPYFDNPPSLDGAWNKRMIAAIRSETTSHLIAVNVANGAGVVKEVPAGISILNYHYAHPPDAVSQNWHHNIVIGFDETGFQGTKAPFYRVTAWDFMLAGGAVYSNLDWSFSVASPTGEDQGAEDRLGPKDPALRPQLGVLKRFMDSLPLANVKPVPKIVKGDLPKGVTVRALGEPGQVYALYVKGGGLAQLQLDLPQALYEWEWIHPVDGRVIRSERTDHPGGIATVSPPGYAEDIALRVELVPRGNSNRLEPLDARRPFRGDVTSSERSSQATAGCKSDLPLHQPAALGAEHFAQGSAFRLKAVLHPKAIGWCTGFTRQRGAFGCHPCLPQSEM